MTKVLQKLNYKWLFVISCFILLIFFLLNIDHNQDVYFMLNHGRYIVNNGFTNIEPFTVHTNMAFSFEKWLCCVLFWKIYEIFGMIGLDIFCYIMTFILFICVYKLTLYLSNGNKEKAVILALITICLYSFMGFIQKRPSVISNVILVIEVLYLEKYFKTGKWQYLISLPILSFILMQFHSTIIPVFYILILPYVFSSLKNDKTLSGIIHSKKYSEIKDIVKNYFKPLKLLLLFSLSSILTACINPYGINSIVYTVKSHNLSNYINIQELQTVSLSNGVYFFICAVVVICYLVLLSNRRNIYIRHFLLFFGLLFTSLYALRNIQFFVLIGIPLIGFFTFDIKHIKSIIALVVTIILLKCLMVYNIEIPKYTLLQDNNIPTTSRVFTGFNIGSQVGFYGYPYYLDGRAEVYIPEINKDENYLLEYRKLLCGDIKLQDFQDKYNFDYYYLAPVENSLNNIIKTYYNWEIVAEEGEFTLWKVPK